jgi:hypothetical protein
MNERLVTTGATPTEIRMRLLRNGYNPLPLNGKAPTPKGWQEKLDTDATEINTWTRTWPSATNTGVLCQRTPFLDIDILSPDAAQAVEDLVRCRFEDDTDIVVRIGLPPKRAIPFKTKAAFDKITVNLVAPNGDRSQKIEFLADGQQCVVDGIHPDTGKPYAWFGRSLADLPRDELPSIGGGQARELVEDIVELLVSEHGYTVSKQTKGEALDNHHPLDWAELTANIINGEGLHDSTLKLAASYIGKGMDPALALKQLHALMLASTGPRDGRWQERLDDLGRLVRDANVKYGKADQDTELTFADMRGWDQSRPPPRQWWLEDRFPLRQPSLVSGEGAIGKSILLLQFLAATSLGLPWLDLFKPEPGPTIYLGAEDEEDEIRRRLAAMLDYHDRRFADLIEGGFKMLPGAGQNVVLAEFDRSGHIKPTPLFEKLYQEARRLKPKGIVIDPVSDVFLGQEIDRTQVRQFGGLLRKLAIDCNCGVVIASHPSLTGIKSGSGLSGSTQWHNSVRARAYFLKPRGDDDDASPDDGRRQLRFMKNQYGPLGSVINLQWRDGLWLPIPADIAAQFNVEELFLRLLARFIDQKRNVSPNKSPIYAPAKFAEQPEAKAAKVSSKDFAEVMEYLLASRQVVVHEEGPPSRPRAYLTLAGASK